MSIQPKTWPMSSRKKVRVSCEKTPIETPCSLADSWSDHAYHRYFPSRIPISDAATATSWIGRPRAPRAAPTAAVPASQPIAHATRPISKSLTRTITAHATPPATAATTAMSAARATAARVGAASTKASMPEDATTPARKGQSLVRGGCLGRQRTGHVAPPDVEPAEIGVVRRHVRVDARRRTEPFDPRLAVGDVADDASRLLARAVRALAGRARSAVPAGR